MGPEKKALTRVTFEFYHKQLDKIAMYEGRAMHWREKLLDLTFPCTDCGVSLTEQERDSEMHSSSPRCNHCYQLYLDTLQPDPNDTEIKEVDGKLIAVDISEGEDNG